MRYRRRREEDGQHLQFVRSLCCVSCGDNTSVEAAHLRAKSRLHGKRQTGMQEKPSDKWTLPLCSECHRKQHTVNERVFWKAVGRDPFVIARALHDNSGDINAAIDILDAHGVPMGGA